MSYQDVHVHGEWPELDGRTCNALVVEEYWYEGALDNPANVIWLRAESTWCRLSIDCGEVFWQEPDREPAAYDLPDLRGSVRLLDIEHDQGLLGESIAGIDGRATAEAVEVVVQFRSGRLVGFRNVGEHTSYYTV